MSTSIVSSRRIVQSARLPVWKATACGLLAHLALIIVVLAPSVAAAASLGLDASWPGQADTEIGMLPAPTQNALCVSDAYPTLAAGFLAGPAPFTGHMLHLATTDNYGVWPESGNLDEANQIPIQGFFGGILPGANWSAGYPELLYDATGGQDGFSRFIMVASAISTTQPPRSWIMVGASAIGAGNIADCVYAFEVNEGTSTIYAAEAPHVGLTKDSLVLTADMFDFANGSIGNFKYAKLWVIPKSRVYNIPHQTCFPKPVPFEISWSQGLQNPDGSFARSVVPAKSYDTGSHSTYLVSASRKGGNSLTLWRVNTKKSLLFPGFAGQSLPTMPYSRPPPAPQARTQSVPSPPPIATGDARLVNAVYQPNSGLWTVHTTACPWNPGLSCFKWYEINPVSGAVMQDSVFGYNVDSVFAPAVAVSRNAAVFAFNSSSPNHFVDVDFVGRYAGDPTNTLGQSFRLKQGIDVYTRGAPAAHSGADTDPDDDNRFWVVGAWASGNVGGQDATCPNRTVNHDWTTEVGNLSFK